MKPLEKIETHTIKDSSQVYSIDQMSQVNQLESSTRDKEEEINPEKSNLQCNRINNFSSPRIRNSHREWFRPLSSLEEKTLLVRQQDVSWLSPETLLRDQATRELALQLLKKTLIT